ncbi:transposase [Paenibacillus sp. JNUCC31]|nr:transposase [Paenibacillus sp. JNUCC-31]
MMLSNEFGMVYNLKRIRRLMKKSNLVCPHRKPNPLQTERRIRRTRRCPTLYKGIQKIPGLAPLTDIIYLPYGYSKMS